MNQTNLVFFCCGLLAVLSFTSNANATIIWTGATDVDAFTESNWDLSDSSVTAIDPNVDINDDLTASDATFNIPDISGQQRFQVGEGFTLTLDAFTVDVSNNDGVGGASNISADSYYEVTNGSSFNPFFITNGAIVNVDATSSINLGGGGNPINVNSKVNLAIGATITLASHGEFAEQGDQIFVNGVSFLENDSILAFTSPGGSTAVAIPEPVSATLLGLAGLTLAGFATLRQRRS